MTDKEIIIDGVNVAGCSYSYFEIYEDLENKREVVRCSIGNAFNNKRCENENCDYKQLRRKEQECEELKNNLHIANTNHEAAEQECDRYKQALEKIEEIFKNDADGDYDFIKFKIFNIINEVKDETNN